MVLGSRESLGLADFDRLNLARTAHDGMYAAFYLMRNNNSTQAYIAFK
jgi:hypothetical protein